MSHRAKFVYLDYASTTPLAPQVRKAMMPYLEDEFGNPSNLYTLGQRAKEAIKKARGQVASVLNCHPWEIIFTGSGTESCNLAVLGVAGACRTRGHIITSKIEHHAVLHPIEALEKQGWKVSYLDVDKFGIINLNQLKKTLTKKTILVSIMYANNEIGTIQPIAEIARLIKIFNRQTKKSGNQKTLFHTDACQAAGQLDLDVKKLGVDLLTINGSKIYGPKGIGALYVKKGIELEPLMYGGEQEKGLRPGTENVAGIVGLGKALTLAERSRKKESQRLKVLRNYLIKEVLKSIPKSFLNGHPQKRLPNNAHFIILDIEGEALTLWLDKYGICASTGSACTSAQLEPSHVLRALGLPREVIHGSLRLTLGRETTKKDIDYLLKVLPKIVKKLRSISPVRLTFDNF